MFDPGAIEVAHRLTRDLAHGALPGSPLRPDRPATGAPVPRAVPTLRQALSSALRRMADLLEPVGERPAPAYRGR